MEHAQWTSTSSPYVRPRRSGEREAWVEEAAAQGRVGSNLLREVAEVQPPAEVAEALRLAEGESAVVRRRVVLLDGEPVELADSFYPPAIARDTPLAEQGKVRGGAVTLLANLGFHTRRVVETVGARPATEQERGLLHLGPHEWVLILTRVTLAEDEAPIEVTVMTMIATGRELRYEVTIDEEG
ncbi:GntR family transcriptional regulator [Nonomuraea sp. NPDC049400]|uniref:GntR family transcriptional regulator n=1 Tax=Nonomuraea sp. NPDC049400 TaxID=3364352 RepID=UPI00378EB556